MLLIPISWSQQKALAISAYVFVQYFAWIKVFKSCLISVYLHFGQSKWLNKEGEIVTKLVWKIFNLVCLEQSFVWGFKPLITESRKTMWLCCKQNHQQSGFFQLRKILSHLYVGWVFNSRSTKYRIRILQKLWQTLSKCATTFHNYHQTMNNIKVAQKTSNRLFRTKKILQ